MIRKAKPHKLFSLKKMVIAIIFLVFILGLVKYSKFVQLRLFYKSLVNYEKTYNYEKVYDLLDPQYRLQTPRDQFIKNRMQNPRDYSKEFVVHSYKVVGDSGFIDRTAIVCRDKSCQGASRNESREIKEYVYKNFRWYIPDQMSSYCKRTSPYLMPDEFLRAIDLIENRFGESEKFYGFANNLKSIKNCLNIQYSDEVKQFEAEGVFYFDANSTPEKLNILVSNDYQIKDDLVTSLLLTHEITHAMNYSLGFNPPCFEDEAEAFYNQSLMLALMNKSEKESIIARNILYKDPQINQLMNLVTRIVSLDGDLYTKTLSIVKNDPYYIKQCSD